MSSAGVWEGGAIFHIAERAIWDRAVREGVYRWSTRNSSFEEVGYVHCGFRHQVERVANAFYRDAGRLVLLEIDPHRAGADVVVESGGDVERFPHLYGPLSIDAVVAVEELFAGPNGLYVPATSWLSPSVEVGDSAIHGRGLVAVLPIDAGEPIGVMGGRVMTDAEFVAHTATASRWSAAALDDGLNILQAIDDPLSRGNHSCDPNLWMSDELTVSARRVIAADEEVTVDYALMTVDEDWQMPCLCGATSCRGVVSGGDWRRPDLQERYRGHFSPFIQRRIDGAAD